MLPAGNEETRMKPILRKYGNPMMWTAVFAALTLYLQLAHRYLFPFIEQRQMFLFDSAYLLDKLARPAGAADLAAEFCLQFFALPWCGAAISAAMLTLTGMATQYAVGVICPRNGAPLLWLSPVVAQILPLLDFDYRLGGIVAYLMATAAFALYIRFATRAERRGTTRTLSATLIAVALFWTAGPAATLFVAALLAFEIVRNSARSYLALIPCAAVALAAAWSVFAASLVGELRCALLPDAFHNPMMRPEPIIRYAWIAWPIIILAATLLARRHAPSPRRRTIEIALQIAVLALLVHGSATADNYYLRPDTAKFLHTDFLMRNGRWDEVIDDARDGITNDLHLYMLNTALVERDMLTQCAFAFPQSDIEGLSIDWSDNNPFLFPMISDMHYAVGNPSVAQETAFKKLSESLAVADSCNPRALMRLAQTGLIYGGHAGYATAEKYIALLERTLFYRRWATEHRRFLYDDQAVQSDPRLGAERRNTAVCEIIYSLDTHPERAAELKNGTLARRTLDHLCMGYLLNADLERLHRIVGLCAGGDLLPELPEYYQEALLIHAAQNRDAATFDHLISESVRKRFLDFQNFAARNYERRDLAAVMRRGYGHTYLYYYMFVKQ